jgi:hypothetical protein
MKHLKKFNEGLDSTKEEILENFLYISDKFGDPTVQSSNYGSHKKWTLSWNINMNFSVMQNAEELIKKLKEITEDIDDVLAATDRLEDFDCNMSISNNLIIELVPKETGSEDYKFIKGYEWRQLYVRKNEVERFFNSKGIRVEKFDNESSYREGYDENYLDIHLSKMDRVVLGDFCRMVEDELSQIDDREYHCEIFGRGVRIFPTEEKSFVELTSD